MSGGSPDRDYLYQTDLRQQIEQRLEREPWVTVYSSERSDFSNGGYFCALIPDQGLADILDDCSWDFSIGYGLPGFIQTFGNGGKVAEYHRFGDTSGIEPFVFVRDFFGIKPSCIELVEEFRHFHNLYHDRKSETYTKVDHAGQELIVAQVFENSVRVRLKEIRQFLGCKEMHLAVFFDFVRFSPLNMEELGDEELSFHVRTDDLAYNFHIAEARWFPGEEFATFSRLLGKKLIPPLPIERCGLWPHEDEKSQFCDFIIGMDENGDPVTYPCDPEGLADFFGKNPHAPNFLTPVFFRPEVLAKYYNNPEKFTVGDGYLRCGDLWLLRLDNNRPEYVIVYLGDLGQTLSYEEQLYWRSFNVPPEGTISSVAFRRGFLAQPADPTRPDLLFNLEFTVFQEQWRKRFGWDFFLPLAQSDEHHFRTLRVPVTEDQAEFDSQILSLTKVLVDSINEQGLRHAVNAFAPDTRGITKLEVFLDHHGYPNTRRDIDFLRDLQSLRSTGVAHRKGRNYARITAQFDLEASTLTEVFKGILGRAITLLDGLSEHFLGEETD